MKLAKSVRRAIDHLPARGAQSDICG